MLVARGIRRVWSTQRLFRHASLQMCSSAGSEDRLHSSDIAFKPTQDGWGYSQTYSARWDQIFKKEQTPQSALNDPTATTLSASDTVYTARLALLQQALDAGALSRALFDQAKAELTDRR